MIKKCNTCGFHDPTQHKCLRFGHQIDPAADFCSKHHDHPPVCVECGKFTLTPIYENSQVFCPRCADAITTCYGCSLCTECSFETDPSPIQKYIVKTTRQGPMVTQTKVRNPDRIAITCKLNCQCWDGEKCGRTNAWCNKYLSRHDVNSDDTIEIEIPPIEIVED